MKIGLSVVFAPKAQGNGSKKRYTAAIRTARDPPNPPEPSAERSSDAEASQVDRVFDPSVDAAALEGLRADAVQGCFTYVDEFTEVISLLTDGGLQVADLTSEDRQHRRRPRRFRATPRREQDEGLHRTEWLVIRRANEGKADERTTLAADSSRRHHT